MGVGTSLVVFAVGAVLRFAVTATTAGFNVHSAGVILMIIGAVGFLVSLAFWGTWGGPGSGRTARRRRTTVSGPAGTTTSTTEEQSTY